MKNLEGISEEIHELRRSRDSLDTILHEREEGVGAESPVGDLSRDARPQTESYVGSTPNKPAYGFKIALVAASKKVEEPANVVMVGLPVGDRDGDPEGCSSFDEQQLGVLSKREELSGERGSESGAVRNEERDGAIVLENKNIAVAVEHRSEVYSESWISESGFGQVYHGEVVVVPVGSCEAVDGNAEKVSTMQDTHLLDSKEQFTEVRLASTDKMCVTNEHLANGEQLRINAVESKLDFIDETGIQESLTENASLTNSQEQESKSEDVNEYDANQHSVDRLESDTNGEARKSDHTCETEIQESSTESDSVTDSMQQTSETEDVNKNNTNQHSFDSEQSKTIDEAKKTDRIGETDTQQSLTEISSLTDSKQQTSETEDVNKNNTNQHSFDSEQSKTIDEASKTDHIGETEIEESLTESASVYSSSHGQKSEDEA